MPRTTFLGSPRLRRLTAVAGVAASASLLSGCLLTSPTWNQAFTSHTDAIPLSAWTTTTAHPVVFQCSPAYHGGLYPPFDPPTWTTVASIAPTGGTVDSNGDRAYAVGGNYVLPGACWRQDPANGVWYAAVRARQTGAFGPADGFMTVDATGLSCVANHVSGSGSWVGWMGKGCEKTYSGSGDAIPFTIIHASS